MSASGSDGAKDGASVPASDFVAQVLDELKAFEQRQIVQFEQISAQLRLLQGEPEYLDPAALDHRSERREKVETLASLPHGPSSCSGQQESADIAIAPLASGDFAHSQSILSVLAMHAHSVDQEKDVAQNISMAAGVTQNCEGLLQELEPDSEGLSLPPFRENPISWARVLSHKVLIEWPYFDYFFGFIIVLNSALIGVETSLRLHGEESRPLQIIEHFFLVLYIIEVAARVLGMGPKALSNPWVQFDCFLVTVGIAYQWIIEPVVRVSETDSRSPLSKFMLLRVLKMMPLLRALRMIDCFKTLWLLMRGLMHSLDAMFATMVLLFLSLYVFACAGVEIIAQDHELRHHPDTAEIVDSNFNSLFTTMLTLGQVTSMDSFAAIYFPLVKLKWSLCFYFVPLFIVVNVSIMNLITASLVEGSMHRGAADREIEKKEKTAQARKLMPDLRLAFRKLDHDGSGSISKEEVTKCCETLPKKLAELISQEDLVELFDVLDLDGSGEVGEMEFIDGVLHVAISDIPMETQRILKMLQMQLNKTKSLERRVAHLSEEIQQRPVGQLRFSRTSSCSTQPDHLRCGQNRQSRAPTLEAVNDAAQSNLVPKQDPSPQSGDVVTAPGDSGARCDCTGAVVVDTHVLQL